MFESELFANFAINHRVSFFAKVEHRFSVREGDLLPLFSCSVVEDIVVSIVATSVEENIRVGAGSP